MTDKGPVELLSSAKRFRELATTGQDPALKDALLQLAKEFELEAVAAIANEPIDPSPETNPPPNTGNNPTASNTTSNRCRDVPPTS